MRGLRRGLDRAAVVWRGFSPSPVNCVRLVVSGLALAAFLSPLVVAQTTRRPSPPLQQAMRAFIEGKYEEVDQFVDKLDTRDPAVVALKARAAIARGQYDKADAALRPVAQRAATSDAALELGLLNHMLGRPGAAAILEKVAALAEVSDQPGELARAGSALRALGRFEEANGAFRAAIAGAPNDPAINTAWGELFLEKYNKPDALKSFQASLQADPRWAPALLGAARTLADENPPQAIAMARRALEINPAMVDAHVFLASEAADADRSDEARQSLEKALAINPSSLDAHALLAAIAYVHDKQSDFEAEVARTLAIAPSYGEVYRIAGDLTAHNYRFDEAVALTKRALAIDPKNPRALADLGTHLLRTGDEPGARTALDASFAIDPYNVVTFNLLGLMDTLDKFTTVRDGDLVFRMSKDEAPVLQDYAVALTHQALNTLSARYEFSPRGPILIEIFPRHDDFAVRNVGLPGMIGALGACFGRVVTMDSPKARPPGSFQWEATLWHELTHVVTLQMSNQRLPRWLSEGISGYEEKRARPEWARQQDLEFAQMLEQGGAVKLKDFNAAFQNPKLISIAYFQASIVVNHLVATFGQAGLNKLVRAFAQGVDMDTALKTALNTDFAQLQAGFDQLLDRQFGDLRWAMTGPLEEELARMSLDALRAGAAEHAGSFPFQMTLGRALRKAGRVDDAMQAFERAAALVPIAQGPESPHAQMAEMALEKKDSARAIAELQALVATDFDNVEAARQLAVLMKQAGIEDAATIRAVNERIAAIDPFDAEAHAVIGRLAMARNEADVAVREFKVVLALGPVDQAAAHTDLAEGYLKGGKRAEAKKQTLAALEIAPNYERAQELLLKLTEGRP